MPVRLHARRACFRREERELSKEIAAAIGVEIVKRSFVCTSSFKLRLQSLRLSWLRCVRSSSRLWVRSHTREESAFLSRFHEKLFLQPIRKRYGCCQKRSSAHPAPSFWTHFSHSWFGDGCNRSCSSYIFPAPLVVVVVVPSCFFRFRDSSVPRFLSKQQDSFLAFQQILCSRSRYVHKSNTSCM